MKQEEKQLLLVDLSARLAFHCRVFYEYVDDLDNKTYGYSLTLNTWCIDEFNANKAVVKPYLRPLSSMTEEDNVSLSKYVGCSIRARYGEIYFPNIEDNTLNKWKKVFDWLNAHHFDYRGLIEKGLAIEITKNNNPYKDYECNIK